LEGAPIPGWLQRHDVGPGSPRPQRSREETDLPWGERSWALESCLGAHHVVVEDPEASWGGFSELEAWLQARRDPVRPRERGVPRRVARYARPLPPRAGASGVRLGRQPCGSR
jgi:hypothetical protein